MAQESSFDWMCRRLLPLTPDGEVCSKCGATPAHLIGAFYVSHAGEYIPSLFCSRRCVGPQSGSRPTVVQGWWSVADGRYVPASPPQWIADARLRERTINERIRAAGF